MKKNITQLSCLTMWHIAATSSYFIKNRYTFFNSRLFNSMNGCNARDKLFTNSRGFSLNNKLNNENTRYEAFKQVSTKLKAIFFFNKYLKALSRTPIYNLYEIIKELSINKNTRHKLQQKFFNTDCNVADNVGELLQESGVVRKQSRLTKHRWLFKCGAKLYFNFTKNIKKLSANVTSGVNSIALSKLWTISVKSSPILKHNIKYIENIIKPMLKSRNDTKLVVKTRGAFGDRMDYYGLSLSSMYKPPIYLAFEVVLKSFLNIFQQQSTLLIKHSVCTSILTVMFLKFLNNFQSGITKSWRLRALEYDRKSKQALIALGLKNVVNKVDAAFNERRVHAKIGVKKKWSFVLNNHVNRTAKILTYVKLLKRHIRFKKLIPTLILISKLSDDDDVSNLIDNGVFKKNYRLLLDSKSINCAAAVDTADNKPFNIDDNLNFDFVSSLLNKKRSYASDFLNNPYVDLKISEFLKENKERTTDHGGFWKKDPVNTEWSHLRKKIFLDSSNNKLPHSYIIDLKKSLRDRWRINNKRNLLERKLTSVLGNRVELNMKYIFEHWGVGVRNSFARSLRYIYKRTKWRNIQWRHNKNYKEIVFSIFVSFLYCKGWMITSTLSRVMSMARRFSLLKKLVLSFEILLRAVVLSIFRGVSLCVHVTGKFKGKARRTNLVYFRHGSNFAFKTLDKTLYDYVVDYALTDTGAFGIKLWLS